MGMSASQVRFLTLQNRKHSIGKQLTTLSNRKMALSRDMNTVAMRYNQALNQKLLKWSNDQGNTYNDLSYDLMMKPNEINTNMPYILSTKDGKVVVDNKTNLLSGLDGRYSNASSTFSSESYVPDFLQGKDITLENIAKWITSEGGGKISVSDKGVISGSESGAYVIPNKASEYGYDNTLRMNIFKEMGLVDEEKINRYYTLLNELYGSSAAKDYGYGEMLKEFDTDKTQTIADSLYHDIFGKLNFENNQFNFDEDTGCAMGNLALAQAYLKEYKAFLRTPLTHDIMADTTYDIAHISQEITNGNWDMIDAKTANRSFKFDYSDITGNGISNRMLEAFHYLESEDLDYGTAGDVSFTSQGIFNHLGFTMENSDGTVVTYDNFKTLVDGTFSSGTNGLFLRYDRDNIGSFDETPDMTSIDNWGKLFDYDGITYDPNGTGYFEGSYYLDENKNPITGCALVNDTHLDGQSSSVKDERIETVTGLYDFINNLGRSFKTIENIDKNAVDFAVEKTTELYKNNIEVAEHTNGDHDLSVTHGRATNVSEEIFGGGWCNRFSSNRDGCAIYATNVMAAFVTFYQMYVVTEGNTGLIQNGTDRYMLTGVAADAAYNYNKNIAKEVATGNLNDALQKSLDDWEKGATGSISGKGSNLESYQVTDDGGSSITYKASIVRNGTSISKITYTITTDSQTVTTSEISINGNNVVEKLYKPNSEGVGEEERLTGGQTNIATITYNNDQSNKNTVTLSDGTIIYMDNKGKVSSIKAASGNEYNLDNKSSIPSEIANYIKKSKLYYIASPKDKSVPDANYKYVIDQDSVEESVFASQITLYPEDKYSKKFQALVDKCQARVDELLEDIEVLFGGADGRVMEFFDAIFERISENGWQADNKVRNNTYVNNKLQNNDYFVTVCQAKDTPRGYKYSNKMATSVTKIFSVYDDNAVNNALAEYESEKREIQSKEDKIDIIMEKLETEQESINTTLESIKKVRDDNIKKKFKMFG